MKRKVLIVEPSEVIVDGLIAALTHSDLKLLTPEYNDAELTARLDMLKPDILIINPTLNDNVTEMRSGRNIAVVALLYQYVKQSRLRHFDAVIDIRDSKQSILQTVLELTARAGSSDNAIASHELTKRETAVLIEVAAKQGNCRQAQRERFHRDHPPQEHRAQDRHQERSRPHSLCPPQQPHRRRHRDIMLNAQCSMHNAQFSLA